MDLESIESEVSEWLESIGTVDGDSTLVDQGVQIRTSLGSRESNQDRIAFVQVGMQRYARTPISCAIVADGMGGMAAGGVAASIAIGSFIAFIAAGRTHGGLKRLLTNAIIYANKKVFEKFRGAGGTTFSAILFGKQGLVGINVGDSRIYSISTRVVRRLTVDDSFAEQLFRISPEKVNYPVTNRDNRLLQFIGIGETLEPHIIDLDNTSLDTMLLLTSDGAHYLGDPALIELSKAGLAVDKLPAAAIEISRMCGSDDNASTLLVPRKLLFSESRLSLNFIRVSVPGNALTITTSNANPRINQDAEHVYEPKVVENINPASSELKKSAIRRIKRSSKEKSNNELKTRNQNSEIEISSLGFVDDETLSKWKDEKN